MMPRPQEPVTQLQTSLKTLRLRWEESKALWDDTVRWDFEENYWQSLEHTTQTALQEMARLAEVLVRAQRSIRRL